MELQGRWWKCFKINCADDCTLCNCIKSYWNLHFKWVSYTPCNYILKLFLKRNYQSVRFRHISTVVGIHHYSSGDPSLKSFIQWKSEIMMLWQFCSLFLTGAASMVCNQHPASSYFPAFLVAICIMLVLSLRLYIHHTSHSALSVQIDLRYFV